MSEINKKALELKAQYDEQYKEWCKDNPGKIMNGLLSQSIAMDFAKHCDTTDELITLHKIYYRRSKEMEGPHGFYFFTSAITELIGLL